jgi:hypothetical protein
MKRSVLLWLFLLVLVASASAWISAQASIVKPLDQPLVLSGLDVGVRVEAWDGNTAIGKLVVRLDGRWVELGPSGGVYRLGK